MVDSFLPREEIWEGGICIESLYVGKGVGGRALCLIL